MSYLRLVSLHYETNCTSRNSSWVELNQICVFHILTIQTETNRTAFLLKFSHVSACISVWIMCELAFKITIVFVFHVEKF